MQIHINLNDYKLIHIQVNLSDDYIQQNHVVQFTNYPDSSDVPDLVQLNSNMDATMSLVTDINTHLPSDEENKIFDFLNAIVNDTIENSSNKKKLVPIKTKLY